MRTSTLIRVSSINQVTSAALLWRQGGVLSATAIVKATFRLVPGGVAELIDPLALVAEEHASPTGSILAADEVVPHIPNAGVVLTGQACACGAPSAVTMTVRLGLARERPLLDKLLYVYGGREVPDPAAAPRPFAKMPLEYSRSYGGHSVPENPVGTGAERGSALPNLVHPTDWRRPAGFAPVGQEWPARRQLRGGLDLRALEGEAPELPASFDLRYFNPAPEDQQLDALRGDEWIVLDGVHPTHARVQTRLPGANARALWYAASVGGARGEATPLDLRAELLVIDADAMVCSVIWRGSFVATGRRLDALHVLTGVELPGAPLALHVPAPTPSGAVDLRAALPGVPDLKAKGPAVTIEGWSAPRGMPPVVRASAEVAMTRQLSDVENVAATIDVDKRMERAALPFQAADPSRPSPMPFVMPKVVRAKKELSSTTGIDVHLLLKDSLPFMHAPPPPPPPPQTAAPVAPALLEAPAAPVVTAAPPAPVVEEVAEVDVEDDDDVEDDGEEEELRVDVRAEVIARLAAGGSLLGPDLVGADLSDLDFRGRLLSGLDLRRANLRGANLAGVRLTGANLAGADLTEAVLSGANLSYATLGRADLTRAKLDGAVLVDASLTGAHGAEVDCSGADLRRAKLGRAKLPGARFAGADLRGAVLVGAELEVGALAGARRSKRKTAP